MEYSTLTDHYAKLTDLSIAARSSRKIIAKALKHGLKNECLTASYLILILSFKEYSYATDLAVDRFATGEFQIIMLYYNQLAKEHPDRHLLIFALPEIRSIIEEVGGYIRSLVCTEELSIGLKT
jgi:hypothetical protein